MESPRVMFRCPEPLKSRLEAIAREDQRSLGETVRIILEKSLLPNNRQRTVDRRKRRG